MADSVLISGITALSGITVAYITARYKNQVSKPKDRIDTAFDMYEAYIKQLNGELERKDITIAKQAAEINRLTNKE